MPLNQPAIKSQKKNYHFFNTLLLGLIIVCSTFSCGKKSKDLKEGLYYNRLHQFIDSLSKEKVALEKYVMKDHKSDTILLQNVNWKKELALILDNIASEKDLKECTYKEYKRDSCTFKEYEFGPKNSFKKILIKEQLNSFTYEVHIIKKNRLSKMDYILAINSELGYLIETKQVVPLAYETEIRIEGKFK